MSPISQRWLRGSGERNWLEDGRNVGSLAASATKLLDLYGANVLASAVDALLAKGSHDLGALAILCEQRRTKPRRYCRSNSGKSRTGVELRR